MKKLTVLLLTAFLAVLPLPSEIWAGEPGVSPVRYSSVHGKIPVGEVRVYPSDNLIIHQENGLYGCRNTDGGLICDTKYKDIVGANGFVLAVEPNGNHTLFDYNGGVRMNADAFKKAMSGGYEVNSSDIGENMVGLYKDSTEKYVDFNGAEHSVLNKLLAESPAGTISYLQEGLIKIVEGDRLSRSDGGMTYAGMGTTYFVDFCGNEVLPREQGYAYMDFSGGFVLRVKLELGYPRDEEVAPLAFYDAKGNFVCEVPESAREKREYLCFIAQDLETRLQFSEAGLAAFQDNDTGLYGFFNKNGLFINNYLEDSEDGYTVKTEVRDMRGSQLFASETENTSGEVTGFAYVFGEGKPVPSEQFIGMTVEPYSRTVIVQTRDSNFFLYDMSGLEIMPPRYESILLLETGDGRLLLYHNGVYEIIKFDTRYFRYGWQLEDAPDVY